MNSPADTDLYTRYYKEIAKNKVLTADQEKDLAKRIKKGDRKAKDLLITSNLRFVVNVANNYVNQGVELQDLINEGNMGLIKAAEKFQPEKGFKFISYAVWWIRQGILQAISDQSRTAKVPLNKTGQLYKYRKISLKLEQKFQRFPTPQEIAQESGWSVEEINFLQEIMGSKVYLDAPISESSSDSLLTTFQDETEHFSDRYDRISLRQNVQKLLYLLSNQEKLVISNYFGIDSDMPLTLDDIGQKLNLTRERIRQIKEKAIKKLKESSKMQKFAKDNYEGF